MRSKLDHEEEEEEKRFLGLLQFKNLDPYFTVLLFFISSHDDIFDTHFGGLMMSKWHPSYTYEASQGPFSRAAFRLAKIQQRFLRFTFNLPIVNCRRYSRKSQKDGRRRSRVDSSRVQAIYYGLHYILRNVGFGLTVTYSEVLVLFANVFFAVLLFDHGEGGFYIVLVLCGL